MEGERAADRMAIVRDDAPGQQMRAICKIRRRRDRDPGVFGGALEVCRSTVGSDVSQDERCYGLVEVEDDRRRDLRQHGPFGRIRGPQLCMGKRLQRQKREAKKDEGKAHHSVSC